MPLPERSVLRVREAPHINPERRAETIVEVWRDGKVVATIYGSREGVHIVSERAHRSFSMEAAGMPGIVVPLLADNEPCPWCANGLLIAPCPVCGKEADATA